MSIHSIIFLTLSVLLTSAVFTNSAGAATIADIRDLTAWNGQYNSSQSAKTTTKHMAKASKQKISAQEPVESAPPPSRQSTGSFNKELISGYKIKTPKVRTPKPFDTFPPVTTGSDTGSSGSSGSIITVTQPNPPLTTEQTDFNYHAVVTTDSEVPVPAAIWLFLSGLLGLSAVVKRRRR